MKSSTIKIAVIGCGNWGKNLIRVFHELGALAAICDHDPAKCALLGVQYQVSAYSLQHICDDPTIDAVAIATPSWTHEEIAARCLKAQKHVYVEKPFTVDTQSAQDLIQLAHTMQRQLMIGHLLQYHPLFNALKQMNKAGVFGKLQSVSSSRCNFGKFATEKSVLWDFSPHDISMVLSLIEDMPQQVYAMGGHFLTHTTVDTISLHLEFAQNIKAHIFASWLHPHKEQKLIVVGSKAMAIFDDCQPWESKLRLFTYPKDWSDGLPQPLNHPGENIWVEKSEPLVNECKHFIESILTKTPPLTDGHEGLRVIRILEAAEQSMIKDRTTKESYKSDSNISLPVLEPA